MIHPIQCTCGALRGELRPSHRVNRLVCYCADCQAYARFLGRADEILDAQGGTEVVHVAPRDVEFLDGIERLACMRLTDRGILRWYAACCRTPIGNTLASYRRPFVGLVHTCVRTDSEGSLEGFFGPVQARVNTGSALGHPKPVANGLPTALMRVAITMIRERTGGGYRHSPFFRATGEPVAVPRVLSATERAAV
jgi:Family of unknown function (DUF6151)